jgi:hypothetical protein
MTGAEHYRAAEQLLTNAAQERYNRGVVEEYYMAAAQVHATLALAAVMRPEAVAEVQP